MGSSSSRGEGYPAEGEARHRVNPGMGSGQEIRGGPLMPHQIPEVTLRDLVVESVNHLTANGAGCLRAVCGSCVDRLAADLEERIKNRDDHREARGQDSSGN